MDDPGLESWQGRDVVPLLHNAQCGCGTHSISCLEVPGCLARANAAGA